MVNKEGLNMPRGDKSSYTDKQKRQAGHIEESYEERGAPEKEAEERAWRTVNKQDHGGRKSGSGRAKPSGGKQSGKKTGKK
jgi:plasmid stabilization system protein ParE